MISNTREWLRNETNAELSSNSETRDIARRLTRLELKLDHILKSLERLVQNEPEESP